jgi:hypothetical protein
MPVKAPVPSPTVSCCRRVCTVPPWVIVLVPAGVSLIPLAFVAGVPVPSIVILLMRMSGSPLMLPSLPVRELAPETLGRWRLAVNAEIHTH